MHKKTAIWISLLIITTVALASFKLVQNQTKNAKPELTTTNPTANPANFLLDGFPSEKIPLYQPIKINSSKIFVNTDPRSTSAFDQTNYAYFNVVFDSTATQADFLAYYRNLFDQVITTAYDNPEMVKGTVGEYQVTAAHYGEQTGYLQVFLPTINSSNLQQYFVNLPTVLANHPLLTEHERSYGLLNQQGGQQEYTQYFTVNNQPDVDEFTQLTQDFQQQFATKSAYTTNAQTGISTWQEGKFTITLTTSPTHGRVYLMLRSQLSQD